VTFGKVTRNPPGSGAATSTVSRNRSKVRIPRRRSALSSDLIRIPERRGAEPSATARASAVAAARASVSSVPSPGLPSGVNLIVSGRQRPVRIQRGEGRCAPFTDGGRSEPVSRHVHGVHRLALHHHTGPGRVVGGEQGVEAVGYPKGSRVTRRSCRRAVAGAGSPESRNLLGKTGGPMPKPLDLVLRARRVITAYGGWSAR
jgi:hypothetical protein